MSTIVDIINTLSLPYNMSFDEGPAAATADEHFAAVHDEGKRRELAAWSREQLGP